MQQAQNWDEMRGCSGLELMFAALPQVGVSTEKYGGGRGRALSVLLRWYVYGTLTLLRNELLKGVPSSCADDARWWTLFFTDDNVFIPDIAVLMDKAEGIQWRRRPDETRECDRQETVRVYGRLARNDAARCAVVACARSLLLRQMSTMRVGMRERVNAILFGVLRRIQEFSTVEAARDAGFEFVLEENAGVKGVMEVDDAEVVNDDMTSQERADSMKRNWTEFAATILAFPRLTVKMRYLAYASPARSNARGIRRAALEVAVTSRRTRRRLIWRYIRQFGAVLHLT